MPLDPLHFRRACALFATGVAVVTTLDELGQPQGVTVNSFTSVSLTPPLVLFCIDHRSSILPVLARTESLVVNILSAEQQALSARFAQTNADRFDNVSWEASLGGAPVLPGALAYLECRPYRTIEAGDHTVFLVEVIAAETSSEDPLLYFRSGYTELKNSQRGAKLEKLTPDAVKNSALE